MRSCEVQLAWADDEASEIRERANAQGIEVKDRGRVPADLVASFNAATLKYPRRRPGRGAQISGRRRAASP